jgi:3',5'-cyclic AMP phosphodiesterase CpdA
MPAPYYTFVAGPIQFFALDTIELSQKQLKWFEEELQKSQSTWKVVYAHHPIFSDGYHGDNSALRNQLLPLLRNRVDLYITGHEHDMQHLKPADRVHFVISGAGGSEVRPTRATSRAFFARAANGFAILEANRTQLDIRLVGADARVMHQYTLRR